MKKVQLDKMVGHVVALHTAKGIEVGVLEKVTKDGVTLRKLSQKDTKDMVQAENVYWGGGFYPRRGIYGMGFPGVGFGGGFGGGFGAGFGAGFGGGFG
ncbi:MAG: hypothetical protein ACXVPC_11720, partial [Tumebacillaceae bacterium]